jgi:hypothetical protein
VRDKYAQMIHTDLLDHQVETIHIVNWLPVEIMNT